MTIEEHAKTTEYLDSPDESVKILRMNLINSFSISKHRFDIANLLFKNYRKFHRIKVKKKENVLNSMKNYLILNYINIRKKNL